MDRKTKQVLREMLHSGQSETSGVADILRTIAENGGGMETTENLVGCAREIAAAAGYFIQQFGGSAERPAGEVIALVSESNPPAFLAIGDEPCVPCLRCLVDRLSERFANGKSILLVQDIENAKYLLSMADTPGQLSDDIEDARGRYTVNVKNGLPLVWFDPQETGIRQVFDTVADALTWLEELPKNPEGKCGLCGEKIKPGDEVHTPCGEMVHNVPPDGKSGESCLETHLRECLRFECNHRHT